MLKKDKNGSPEWLTKLPQMAKQLEVSLYRNARSFDAYMDMTTLKQRLQQIAVEVSRKARNQGDSRNSTGSQSSSNNARTDNSGSGSPFVGMSSSQHGSVSSNRGQIMNPNDINNMANSHSSGMNDIGIGGNMGGSMGSSSGYNQQRSIGSGGLGNNRVSSGSSSGAGISGSGAVQNRNDPEWKVRIRHKQQRLLLLHHSAKCPHDGGRCTVTPHCADMKRLWKHMEGCKDNACRVSHCFSSRAILSHYRKCKDTKCPACGPVRDTVRKSQNRSSSGSSSSIGMRSSSTSNNNNMMVNGMADNSNRMMSNQQHSMVPTHDISVQPFNSSMAQPFNQQQNQPPQIAMPPPNNSQMNSSGMQFSSMQSSQQQQQYRSMSSSQPTQKSSQQVYRSDQQGNQNSSMGTMGSIGGNDLSINQPISSSMGQGSSGKNEGSENRRNDSEWQKVRHKQQRLLLLRHASRCTYTDKCPVTPHCASMKKLWEHIAHCKDQQCNVPHCMSSRYVLSHYRRCKDTRCPACAPVRETIRKSHEKDQGGSGRLPSGGDVTSFDIPQQNASGNMSGGMGSLPMANADSGRDYMPQAKRTKTDHSPQGIPQISSLSSSDPTKPGSGNIGQPVSSGPGSSSSQPVADPSSSSSKPSRVKSESQESAKADTATSGGKADDRSLLNSFTTEQLTTHLASLNGALKLAPPDLKKRCSEVLKGLQQHQHGWVFNCPVDPVDLGLPDYFEVIKKPMDLGTIQKKLDQAVYHELEEFAGDAKLTFDNAMTYNEEATVVYDMAKELKIKFEADWKKLLAQLGAEDRERRKNDRACVLCGCEKRLFEPPVYFCNGANCSSMRIRRNSHFYMAGNNQYFWCNQCYNDLEDKKELDLIDLTISKSDLVKKKNDEVHEESWVQCDSCNRWIHQICGLFNTRQNKEHHSEYCCPLCLLGRREKSPSAPSPGKPPCAAELPRTKLSEHLENSVRDKIEAQKRKMAEEMVANEVRFFKNNIFQIGITLTFHFLQNLSMDDAMKYVNEGGPVIIRQVTSMDRKLEVRERMKERYKHKKYPDEFPFRCKCLVVFQHIDGVDVVLFALYVYEHGEDNPPPNQRCVYVSYLDSVHFMKPRRMRTFVYHEILIAYLDYVRQRGFATAHIWSCPPLKGDDYIFYAKPEDQRTPKEIRLRSWYVSMLKDCQYRNIVGKVVNMYDLYFSNPALDATAVPYLEGDYFPGEAEAIIKSIEEGNGKKNGNSSKKNKKKQTNKAKNRGGTRSTGVDEEALIASGMMDGVKDFSELDRDQVMVKMGETILPMKENFLVAFLNWSGAKKEDMEVPEDVQNYRKEHPDEIIPFKASSNKRDADGKPREEVQLDQDGNPIKVIDDDVEDLDCEFLNNRQAFLNLCRGNHYQFDELRRAKHTSMMVLWHLHNRDAPKFVQQCVACNREILSGKRYHCPSCQDYDLCEACYNNPKTNRGNCTHKLQPIAVENNQEEQGSASGLTEEQRKQRQRNLMLHIQLIEHASRCNSTSCKSTNCVKMKQYLEHARQCKVSFCEEL